MRKNEEVEEHVKRLGKTRTITFKNPDGEKRALFVRTIEKSNQIFQKQEIGF